MTIAGETYIGDKNTFAIRYQPSYVHTGSENYYVFCHLVLSGQIIGDVDEVCYLNSWKSSLEYLKDRIKYDFSSIGHTEFLNRSDREVFELIWKANQLEEEFKEEYNYLPVLNNEVWSNCRISIDETTDAYLLAMTEADGKIKFLWEGWGEPCPADRIGKLFSITLDKDFVAETMESCLATIESDYLSYPAQ